MNLQFFSNLNKCIFNLFKEFYKKINFHRNFIAFTYYLYLYYLYIFYFLYYEYCM